MTDESTATPAAGQPEQVIEADKTEVVAPATTETQEGNENAEESEGSEKRTPWFQKRINDLTRDKYEAKRDADAVRAEAQALREQLARAQAGESFEAPAGDVKTLVQQEAARIVAERTFNETCNKVYADGKKEFKDFDAAVSNLQLVGVGRDFLELATTSDAGAKLLHHLGSHLEEAERIASLPPVQMARELTRLEYQLAQKVAKPVSNAPPPIAPIAGSKGGTKGYDPAMTDAEYAAFRQRGRNR